MGLLDNLQSGMSYLRGDIKLVCGMTQQLTILYPEPAVTQFRYAHLPIVSTSIVFSGGVGGVAKSKYHKSSNNQRLAFRSVAYLTRNRTTPALSNELPILFLRCNRSVLGYIRLKGLHLPPPH